MTLLTYPTPSDPRDQPVTPQPYYVQFRQSLKASEHITVLAKFLRHVVDLYDGRLMQDDSQPPELRYIRASELAVRYCSVESRTSAERRAEAHGISRFDDLLADLKLPEATEAVRREMLAQYVHDCIRVYCYSLTHACGRSKEEVREFNRLEARDAGQ